MRHVHEYGWIEKPALIGKRSWTLGCLLCKRLIGWDKGDIKPSLYDIDEDPAVYGDI